MARPRNTQVLRNSLLGTGQLPIRLQPIELRLETHGRFGTTVTVSSTLWVIATPIWESVTTMLLPVGPVLDV